MPKKYLRVMLPENWKEKKHHNDKNWKNIIYYSERKKLNAENIVNTYERCAAYQKNTFYKVQGMSKDYIWDYYRILKPFPAKNIAVKVKPPRKFKTGSFLTITRFPPDNPCVIRFD